MPREGDFVVVCHFVGTEKEHHDDDEKERRFTSEIIEVTLLLLDSVSGNIDTDEYHAYVRPRTEDLNERTIRKTGFMVDQAERWKKVLVRMEDWLNRKGDIVKDKNFILVTIGPQYEELLQNEKKITREPLPRWFLEYVNFQREFKHAFQSSESNSSLAEMMATAGMEAETNPDKPRGRDQAYDLALMVSKLIKEKHEFESFDKINDN